MKNKAIIITIIMILPACIISAGENVIVQSSGLYATGDAESAEIHLIQSNEGLITGDGNILVQSNAANIDNYGTGIINFEQHNIEDIVGDNNSLFQINYELVRNWGTGGNTSLTQENIAAIIGDKNRMEQENNAVADLHGLGNFVSVSQRNTGLLERSENVLKQENRAGSYVNGSNNCVSQIESNLAAISGYMGNAYQNNSQQAYPDPAYDDEYDEIEQSALNTFTMTSTLDISCQINYQDAFQLYYSDEYINQSAWNNIIVNGPVEDSSGFIPVDR
mgnify:CR=1 FL=1